MATITRCVSFDGGTGRPANWFSVVLYGRYPQPVRRTTPAVSKRAVADRATETILNGNLNGAAVMLPVRAQPKYTKA